MTSRDVIDPCQVAAIRRRETQGRVAIVKRATPCCGGGQLWLFRGWIHPSLKIPGSYRKGQVLKSSSFQMVDQQLVAVVFSKEVSKSEGWCVGENPSGRQPCDLLQHCGMMCWLKYLRLSKFSAKHRTKTSTHRIFWDWYYFP